MSSPRFPEPPPAVPPTPIPEIDALVARLVAKKYAWVAVDLPKRVALLRACIDGLLHAAGPWVEAGALATGSTLEISDVCPPYAHMEHDHDLAEIYRANAGTIGRPDSQDGAATFSTDMGNVSLAMPSIHPCIAIETGGAVNHQPEFTRAAVNASADRAVLEGALAMAWSVIDAATGPLRDRLLQVGT